ncbi:MAG: neutral/alkaline non-lysosomal ceramidase N-terminal domain-containing protein [Candidatus Bipolaricaulaceae bacterium]
MRAGIAKADITPEGPVPMAGYVARRGWSVGVHDRLWVRCFTFHGRSQDGAVVVLDLLGLSQQWASAVQRRVAEAAGVPAENVLVACTHTHAGPTGLDGSPYAPQHPPFPIARLPEEFLAKAEGCARQAAQTAFAAQLGVGSCPVTGIGGHRTEPHLAVDQTLWLTVVAEAGTAKAVLACFPCHSTVLGADNRFLSGDLLGAAAAGVERSLGRDAVAAFVVGAAGDISTRFLRREQTFAEVDRLGNVLTQAAVNLADLTPLMEDPPVAFQRRRLWLPVKALPSEREAVGCVDRLRRQRARMVRAGAPHGQLRVVQTRLEGAELLLASIRQAQSREGISAEVAAARLGAGLVAGVPGEPFNEVGRRLNGLSDGRFQVAVAGQVGGNLGYFPTRDAVESGWYEDLGSPFDHRATELVRSQAQALLEGLRGERG